MITVALDSGGADAARPWIERAHPSHPSLIDRRHVVADLYQMVNVPTAVWIDEDGVIVRPPETPASGKMMADLLGIETNAYLDAIRDWVAKGPASVHVPPPRERVARQHAPDSADALAAANFRLGEYLFAHGDADAARPYFEEAMRLRPESWTYRRQAWANYDPRQNAGRGWYEAMLETGDTPYYAPVRLGDALPPDDAEAARRQRELLSALIKPLLPPEGA